jgi:hypothetical protein
MTGLGNSNMTYADLERLLEVYGSDRTRWPVEARASAGQLVARDAAARRLLAEMEALDRILERAPLPSLAREAALAERVAAAAQRSPRMVPHAEGVKAFVTVDSTRRPVKPFARTGQVIGLPLARTRLPAFAASRLGGAASVLAASLLVGIFIGMSSLPPSVAGPIEQATGLTLSRSATTVAQIDLLDEDLL